MSTSYTNGVVDRIERDEMLMVQVRNLSEGQVDARPLSQAGHRYRARCHELPRRRSERG